MAEAPAVPAPKEFLTSLLAPLAEMEANFKKPFIDAGFPDIPSPAEMQVKLIETMPEMPTEMPKFLPFLVPSKPEVVEEAPPEAVLIKPPVKYG